MPAGSPEGSPTALLEQVREQSWYHTLDLAPGVVTEGLIDLRSVAPRVLPADLSGRRALDVGTFDGFWAFELERRGAEVVAADLDDYLETDWPPATRRRLESRFGGQWPGERFALASRVLGSGVKRVGSSIYALDPERLDGPVDLAVIGALLLHLRDPVAGLERVRSVLRPDGRLLLVEPFDPVLTLLRPRRPSADMRAARTEFDWWVGNVACLRALLAVAGFTAIERRLTFRSRSPVREMRQWHVALEARPADDSRPGA